MSFTHLHVHSEYSLLDGLVRLDDLIERVKSMGMTSVALTDHGAMYGAFSFYIKARDAGIKPIIGVEAYKARGSRTEKTGGIYKDQYHVTLLAKNYEGYKNLIKLTTEAHLEGFYYKPRIDFELLEKYHEGIIVLSGCMSGEISKFLAEGQVTDAEKVITRYKEIFGADFYLEIQRFPGLDSNKKINQELISLSRKCAVPLVATNDVHYLEKDHAYAQEILLCIQSQHTIFEKDRQLSMLATPEFYLKSVEEMNGLFVDLPEAIENTQKIADMCNIEIPYGKWILPNYPIPNKESPSTYLRSLTYQVAPKRVTMTDEIKTRLDYELSIIEKKDYSTYFLIVQDFVNWAKQQGIAVGPGRGSAAGSLVAYVLNITDINPLDYSLPFERFLNPDRPTPPDFDIDFADIRRDEVLAYVTEKYGKDKVAQIITFGRMEARLAIRDVTRALGLSYSHGDRIAKMIPQGKQGFAMTIDRAIEENPGLRHAYQEEEQVKKVLDIARQVEGVARHSSVHAAGVVMSDKALTEYVPLQRESKGDRIITQYDMYALDLNAVSENKAVGLLKMDFLGLRNLTIIEQAIHFITQATGNIIDIHNIPLDDAKTYELVSSGKTIGVFQLESRGMRSLAKDLRPTKLSDISAMVALYRPGPMDLIPMFLEGKQKQNKIRYLHKDLQPILAETYGVLVYQEQVMEIANKIAGYSMSEADNLRMAMGKKKKSLMTKEEKKFIERCINSGYDKKLAEKIFGFIEKFVGYGFNKPHSASYALIAYWTAYLKANYPVEYMTALLTAELQGSAGVQKEVKVYQALEECRSMGLSVLPPDINKSESDFITEGTAIRFGLSAVKGVGRAAIDSIIEARNNGAFLGFIDFLNRVDLRRVNKKTVEGLVKVGAFDVFGTRATFLASYPEILEKMSRIKRNHEQGQDMLFTASSDIPIDKEILVLDEFSDSELVTYEKEVLGFPLSKNPLYQYRAIIDKKITKKIGELSNDDINKTHILGGTISQVKDVVTKKSNSKMAFVLVFDETGSIEGVVFPRVYADTKAVWKENTPILVKGRIEEKQNVLTIIVEKAVDMVTLQTPHHE